MVDGHRKSTFSEGSRMRICRNEPHRRRPVRITLASVQRAKQAISLLLLLMGESLKTYLIGVRDTPEARHESQYGEQHEHKPVVPFRFALLLEVSSYLLNGNWRFSISIERGTRDLLLRAALPYGARWRGHGKGMEGGTTDGMMVVSNHATGFVGEAGLEIPWRV
jgi:hypothetical protein